VAITVFEVKRIPATRRERIEAAVVAGGRHLSSQHEAWITADPFRGGIKVLITGPTAWSERQCSQQTTKSP
jgi:hypothetical protein